MSKFFCNSMSDDIDKNSWVKMRSHLSVDIADLDFVKFTADPARHGSFIDIPSSLREKIFTTTSGSEKIHAKIGHFSKEEQQVVAVAVQVEV